MRATPPPIKFNATNGTSVNLGASESVTLDIPPGSVLDENNEVFEGEVSRTLLKIRQGVHVLVISEQVYWSHPCPLTQGCQRHFPTSSIRYVCL